MKSLNTVLRQSKGKTLMVIYPHPDDETMASGGLLLAAKRYGLRTVVLTLTHGDKGKVHIAKNGRSTSQIRKAELNQARALLNVDKLILEKFPDGNLKGERVRWRKVLTSHLVKENPDIVVTYDHSGITGHPDHIVLSLELYALFKKIPRGRRPELWWMTAPQTIAPLFAHKEVLSNMTQPTGKLDLTFSEKITKIRAGLAHKSQRVITPRVIFFFLFLGRNEWYHKVNFTKVYKHAYVPFDI